MKDKSIMHFSFVVALIFSSFTLNGMPNKGRNFDLQGFIDKEISSGKKIIIVPEGTYRVKPQNSEHLHFKNLKDITIIADKVEMICTETTRAITFENCTNVTLRGLVIDYDPLCFSQGKITKLSSDKSTIEFILDDNYPDNLVERIEIFDPKTNLLKRSSHYGWTKFEKIADRYYRVTKGQKYKFKPTIDTEEVGDILVTNNDYTPNGRIPHAVFSNECVNLKLENITLYSGNCFGFFETNGTKNTYLKCIIDRRSPETDMYVRSKRMRSNDADAFHSKYATIGPQIIECSAKFQGDDGINICGKYYLSIGAVGNTIRVIVPQTCDLSAGNNLEILTNDSKRLPVVKILKIENDRLIANEEIEAVKKLKQNENNKRRLSNPQNKIIKLIVDNELTFGFGAVIADINKMGNGFLVKNCNFSYNRSRGILIKASNGSVIGNTLQGNWMSSVLISPEAWWLESGCSDNIEVSNNIFLDNKKNKVINITGEGFDGETAPTGLHNNINITNNQFTNCLLPVIYLASTKDGNITGNKITKPAISNQNVQYSTNAMVINSENVKTDF